MGISERREREREARRSTVLDAARELLLERGFTGTTTKLIAERCEFSEATLFFYFRSKDEILVSLLFEGVDFWTRGLQRIARLELAHEERIARVWRYFGEVRNEHPEYFHLSAYIAQPHALDNVTEQVRADIAHRSGENFALLGRLLEGPGDAPSGRLAADLLWGAFLGLMTLRDARANVGAKPHPNDRELAAALRALLGGFATGPVRG